jgi:hypothetical protein
MSEVLSRVRLVQPDGRVQQVQVVTCDRTCEGEKLHLHLEVVENGHVSYVGMFEGDGMEAMVRSARFMRVVLQMIYGMAVDADELTPRPETDGDVLVIPGTPTGIA